MKKLIIVISFLMIASSAFGDIITFDPTFPSIPSDVTVQYFNNGLIAGPLATLPTPNTVPLTQADSAIPSGGNALKLWQSGQSFGPYGVLFTFDVLQTTVSAIGNDFGGDPVNDNEVVYLTAFDSSGNVIGFSSFSSPYDDPNLKPISFTDPGGDIKYIAFTWTTDLGYYAVDNIEYGARVPEPTTVILIGFGLLGLAGLRKKFKK